jgi:hypothetical protein
VDRTSEPSPRFHGAHVPHRSTHGRQVEQVDGVVLALGRRGRPQIEAAHLVAVGVQGSFDVRADGAL